MRSAVFSLESERLKRKSSGKASRLLARLSGSKARLLTAWEIFQDVHFAALAVKTRAEYQTCMRKAFDLLPEQFGVPEVLRWHRVTMLQDKALSVKYCNMCLAVAKGVTRKAAVLTGDNDLASIFWHVRPFRAPLDAVRCPPTDAVRLALGAAKNPAERAWILLAGLAGLRCGELQGLRAEDYHRDTRVLYVVRQRESEQRKNRRPHSVRLDSDDLCEALEWAIAHPNEVRPRKGWHKGRGEGFIFPWANNYLLYFMRRIRAHFEKTLGVEMARQYLPQGVAWHAFRHWGATELARKGASPVEVQQWLGDSSPDVAMRYVAMVRGMTAGSVAKLATLLGDDQTQGEGKQSTSAEAAPSLPTATDRRGAKPCVAVGRDSKPRAQR